MLQRVSARPDLYLMPAHGAFEAQAQRITRSARHGLAPKGHGEERRAHGDTALAAAADDDPQ